jgi:basic membrane lipoprotein Med (substrate-binding protein (PBP1-ABC) superfamily)/ABC-type branched-subunit amino acid transport system substrate-binding protein
VKNIRKLSWLMLLVLVISMVATACGGGEDATSTPQPEPTEAPEPTKAPEVEAPTGEFRVGMISDVGGVDDASFNQTTWEGLDRADRDIEGVAAQFLESQAQADYENNITEFAEQGYDMIVTVGFLLGDATAKMAEVYPDIKFAIIDFAYDPPIPNVQGIVFNSDEAAFLAGYLAAGMAVELDPGDPQIGWVGGMQIPPVEIFIAAYESGMAYYNAQKGTDVKVAGTYVGDFEAPDEGKTAGNSLLDEGVDIIFGVGGKTGNGGLVAVRERAEAGEAVAGIGVDVDQYFTLPTEQGILITSVEKRLDNAVYNSINDAVAGNFGGGGVYVGTLENDGVGLAPYHDWEDRVPDELKAEVEALRPQIIAGTISTGWPPGAVEEPELPEGCVKDLTGETFVFYSQAGLTGALSTILGTSFVNALNDSIADLNAAGGICGAMVELDLVDTQYEAEQEIAAYQINRAAEPKPLAIATYGSAASIALRDMVIEDHITNFAAGLNADAFYLPRNGYTVGVAPIYSDQFAGFVQWLSENWDDIKPADAGDEIVVGVVGWEGPFGAGATTPEALAYAESLGVTVLELETYAVSAEADLVTPLQSLAVQGANVIYVQSLGFGAAQAIGTLRALGMWDSVVVGGNVWSINTDVLTVLGDSAPAMIGFYGMFPWRWWNDTDVPGVQQALAAFERGGYPEADKGVSYISSYAGTFAWAEIIKHAISRVGYENLDGEAFFEAFQDLGTVSALGIFEYDVRDETRAPRKSQVRQVQLVDGEIQFIVVQDFFELPDTRPPAE